MLLRDGYGQSRKTDLFRGDDVGLFVDHSDEVDSMSQQDSASYSVDVSQLKHAIGQLC